MFLGFRLLLFGNFGLFLPHDVCCEVVVLFDNTTNHSTAIQNSKRLWLEYLFNATSLIEDGSEVFRLLARCVALVVVSEDAAAPRLFDWWSRNKSDESNEVLHRQRLAYSRQQATLSQFSDLQAETSTKRNHTTLTRGDQEGRSR